MRDSVVSIKNFVLNTQPLKWLVQLAIAPLLALEAPRNLETLQITH